MTDDVLFLSGPQVTALGSGTRAPAHEPTSREVDTGAVRRSVANGARR